MATREASWVDLNGDGWEDLFLAGAPGSTSFYMNMEGTFLEVTDRVGLSVGMNVLDHEWRDIDGSGVPALILTLDAGIRIYRNVNSMLQAVALPRESSVTTTVPSTPTAPSREELDEHSTDSGQESFSTSGPPIFADALIDRWGGGLIGASRTPTVGLLYPMTKDFRVHPNGNVTIGTNQATARLDVAGMIRSRAGGFRFPDDTVQTTAQLVGPIGPQGPTGPAGPAGTGIQMLGYDRSSQEVSINQDNGPATLHSFQIQAPSDGTLMLRVSGITDSSYLLCISMAVDGSIQQDWCDYNVGGSIAFEYPMPLLEGLHTIEITGSVPPGSNPQWMRQSSCVALFQAD